jgi:hypothetical protein
MEEVGRRDRVVNVMKAQGTIGGSEEGRRPQAKECSQNMEAGTGKKTNSGQSIINIIKHNTYGR